MARYLVNLPGPISKPKAVLEYLRTFNPDIMTTEKDIANLKYRQRLKYIGEKGVVNTVLNELEELNYHYQYKCDDEGHLTHLFICHRQLGILSRQHSSIFLLDCTYRTNEYDIPLLSVVAIDFLPRYHGKVFYRVTTVKCIEGANDYDTILYHNIGHNYWAGVHV
jgi:hypothetical protein